MRKQFGALSGGKHQRISSLATAIAANHAILIIRSDRGDLVLDNRRSKITTKQKTENRKQKTENRKQKTENRSELDRNIDPGSS
ncbi:MAG: transglutaminase-like cysteine peptidase [Cohaesibacteraceae bacterium]|nr:transglutaminase-like cysteine peptidase [Cohaesibacteraceae bacterium]